MLSPKQTRRLIRIRRCESQPLGRRDGLRVTKSENLSVAAQLPAAGGIALCFFTRRWRGRAATGTDG
jgi:hypothetical protein